MCRPGGAHDYFNVMWDPHVHRGSTYQTFKKACNLSFILTNMLQVDFELDQSILLPQFSYVSN